MLLFQHGISAVDDKYTTSSADALGVADVVIVLKRQNLRILLYGDNDDNNNSDVDDDDDDNGDNDDNSDNDSIGKNWNRLNSSRF